MIVSGKLRDQQRYLGIPWPLGMRREWSLRLYVEVKSDECFRRGRESRTGEKGEFLDCYKSEVGQKSPVLARAWHLPRLPNHTNPSFLSVSLLSFALLFSDFIFRPFHLPSSLCYSLSSLLPLPHLTLSCIYLVTSFFVPSTLLF